MTRTKRTRRAGKRTSARPAKPPSVKKSNPAKGPDEPRAAGFPWVGSDVLDVIGSGGVPRRAMHDIIHAPDDEIAERALGPLEEASVSFRPDPEASDAGADFAGGEELIKKIQEENWLDFERVIATPDIMGAVGRIGKILGPRGLMPNPKVGTVTFDVAKAVKEVKAGKVDYRVDKAGVIHVPVGKVSFGPEKLIDNARALLAAIVRAKPSTAKGNYVQSVAISSTMGPGIKIDSGEARILAAAA